MLKKLAKKLQMDMPLLDPFQPNGKGGLKPDIHWGQWIERFLRRNLITRKSTAGHWGTHGERRSSSTIESISFEKDDNPVEEYTTNGRTFYILLNIDSITATWSDGQSLLVFVSGNIPKDEIIAIIDSMGG